MLSQYIQALLLFGICLAASLEGNCALYDVCGKKSIFGAQLPCATSVKPQIPSPEDGKLLKEICGKDFDISKICCSSEQIQALKQNLKKVDPLVSSCPACKHNFYKFFCEFSCSSNQASFVNVTQTTIAMDTKQEIVTEITQYVNSSYAAQFFDSCKEVKFSATNGFAMDLIGGGAKNYSQFLKFLGDEKPLLGGSPFQINFAYDDEGAFKTRTGEMKSCADKDYKCACSDCKNSCPILPEFKDYNEYCLTWGVPCFTFYLLATIVVLTLLLGLYHVYLFKILKKRNQSDVTNVSDSINRPQESSKFFNIVANFNNSLIVSIENSLQSIGLVCALHPWKTLIISFILILITSAGLFTIELEIDPVSLWVSSSEPALLEKQYFETHFGEFYRIEQLIVSKKNESSVLDWQTIQWWFEKEKELAQLNNVNLSDICFKPMGEDCIIESFTQYFHGVIDYLNPQSWQSDLKYCTNSPVNCLPTFQQPLKPNILFSDDDPLKAKAFMVTMLINSDSSNTVLTDQSILYEKGLQKWAHQIQHEANLLGLQIDFSTEVSLTQELNKSTNTDFKIIIISYLVMFLYASLGLSGKIPKFNGLKNFVNTRFQLGFSGIIIILLSVTSSAGICAFIGIKSTLIIAEVIPFLILAVGIDNIFLITHELDIISLEDKKTPVEIRISNVLKNVGPSCLTSALLQFCMFLIATSVDMPAVKNFAIYSAGAIIVNCLLQMTVFISLLSLDQQRLESGRVDFIPWIQAHNSISLDEEESVNDDTNLFDTFITKFYSVFIFSKRRKLLGLFGIWFTISLSLLPYIEYGLDQRIALPSDSYLIPYFNSVYKYMNVGPPVYFIVKNANVTERQVQQDICGKFSACKKYSLNNILQQEYARSNISTIAEPTASWIDDFFGWLNPDLDQCCRFKKNSLIGTFDRRPEFCTPFTPDRQCRACYEDAEKPYDSSMANFPQGQEFMFYFNQWIEEPSDPCPLGGKAPYSSSISQDIEGNIVASSFRTSHTPLRSQNDFIVAFKNSKRISKEIENSTGLEVFAYSPFYVFFVQYETILQQTITLLTVAMIVIFALAGVLLNSVKIASLVVITVTMILIDILAVMAVWGVSLNAVSLVNLIICVGISVEFTIHVAKSFTKIESDNSLNRSIKALEKVGGSVLGGITITKFIGVAILAFTQSKIFEVYYFRMWICLVVIAAIHGLCFLPILLSYIKV